MQNLGLGKSPFINLITEMREEERALLESELSSLRHHLHEAEAAIAVRICTNMNSNTGTNKDTRTNTNTNQIQI